MIVKNTGITKVVKINSVLHVIKSGINSFEDTAKIRSIIAGHNDLSILKDPIVKKEIKKEKKDTIKKVDVVKKVEVVKKEDVK